MSVKAKKSWIEIPKGSDFTLENIPFGIAGEKGAPGRPCTRIGNTVIDLHYLFEYGCFHGIISNGKVFKENTLNSFIALGKKVTNAVRKRIIELFAEGNKELEAVKHLYDAFLIPENKVKMHLPVRIGNYTDFYSSEEHATNVGKMFRDPANALLPNWKHIPVGYHGRASSIVVSGTNIHRPKGQIKANEKEYPDFGPSGNLDFELELAFVTGKDTELGTSIPTARAEDYIFGLVLFNDLSARDIQKWEYVPLGPFLSKNFASLISPWIVTLEALEPFRIKGPVQNPEVLPYLQFKGEKNYDINLEVSLIPASTGKAKVVCSTNFKYMYWNMCQQLAHHTINGCNICVGDMYGSGTISGPDEGSFGSMLELTWNGTKPIQMPDGSTRKFLEDHDSIVMKGWSERNGIRVGFGECRTTLLPVKK